jgi:hypothetical protein
LATFFNFAKNVKSEGDDGGGFPNKASILDLYNSCSANSFVAEYAPKMVTMWLLEGPKAYTHIKLYGTSSLGIYLVGDNITQKSYTHGDTPACFQN